jgi:molybdopterin synthase catalytic subunit/molybdopterin converting factor small subunit
VRVRVRLFGALAERAGGDEALLDVGDDATAADVLEAVRALHPQAAGMIPRLKVAVNLEVVPGQHRIGPGDEVALLPPVAGGQARILTGFRDQLSIEEAMDAVADPDAGGIVAFVGTVRAEEGRVTRLRYSAYREMAERLLRDVAEEAAAKWPLHGAVILHGMGDLGVGERTVVVACSAGHRGDAFDACRYAIDEVKRRAPVWKQEVGPGGERWVGLE